MKLINIFSIYNLYARQINNVITIKTNSSLVFTKACTQYWY